MQFYKLILPLYKLMEKKNLKMKNNFTQLITQISKLYKDASNSQGEAYNLGKKEAYEEILSWFLTSHNGDLKYVSATSFFNMIQEKLTKVKMTLKANGDGDSQEEDIKPLNLADIKISDNRKRARPTDMDIEEPCFNLGSPEYNPNSNNGTNALPQAKKKKFK
jgi:hypothetical protein